MPVSGLPWLVGAVPRANPALQPGKHGYAGQRATVVSCGRTEGKSGTAARVKSAGSMFLQEQTRINIFLLFLFKSDMFFVIQHFSFKYKKKYSFRGKIRLLRISDYQEWLPRYTVFEIGSGSSESKIGSANC